MYEFIDCGQSWVQGHTIHFVSTYSIYNYFKYISFNSHVVSCSRLNHICKSFKDTLVCNARFHMR